MIRKSCPVYPPHPLTAGDMYFDLRGVITPLECAHPSKSSAHDCDNPEVTADDLVITKLELEVHWLVGWLVV